MFKKLRKVAVPKNRQKKKFVDTQFDTNGYNNNRNPITTWQYAGYASHIDNLTR